MEFISYAQNYEDVILWRALKNETEGFYVDVGALDPKEDSVTLAFYERGWKGINIEASSEYFASLATARPRDTNVHAFVSNKQGLIRFFNVPHTGYSTFDAARAESYRHDGMPVEERLVAALTLTEILDASAVQTIHFLKVDVEGAERLVFEGLDLSKYRPWIILAEATKPDTRTPSHQDFEELITGAGYQFSTFDGVNRYYVSNERFEELSPLLALPPIHYFDNHIRASEWEARNNLAVALNDLKQTRQELAMLKAQATQIKATAVENNHIRASEWEARNNLAVALNDLRQTRQELAILKARTTQIKTTSVESKRKLDNLVGSLTQAVRRHFGKRNLKLGDPEPRFNPFKRFFRTVFRKQGAVNKALISAFRSQLSWNKETEKRLNELRGIIETLNGRLQREASEGDASDILAAEGLSASAKRAYRALCVEKSKLKQTANL